MLQNSILETLHYHDFFWNLQAPSAHRASNILWRIALWQCLSLVFAIKLETTE
jgi:hypothetical protein